MFYVFFIKKFEVNVVEGLSPVTPVHSGSSSVRSRKTQSLTRTLYVCLF